MLNYSIKLEQLFRHASQKLAPLIQPLPTPIQSPLRLKGEQRDHCMSNQQEPWSSHHGPC
jgi:hypothetical protein